MRIRGARIAGVVLAVVTLWPGSVSAQEYPLREGSLLLTEGGKAADRLKPGAAIRIQGSGYVPGSLVTVTLESTPVVLGDTPAGGAGAIDTTVKIPRGTQAGNHEIKATGAAPGGGTLVLRQPVVVAAGRAVAGDDARDEPGSSAWPWFLIGGVAVVLMLVLVASRRRLRRV